MDWTTKREYRDLRQKGDGFFKQAEEEAEKSVRDHDYRLYQRAQKHYNDARNEYESAEGGLSDLPKEIRQELINKIKLVERHRKMSDEEFNISRGRKEREELVSLSSRLSPVITIIGVIAALFFLSTNLTGNVVGSLNQTSSNVIGIIFLVVALFAGVYWVKKNK